MSKIKSVSVLAAIAVAGYVAGILTAPKSGKQTRKELKKYSTNLKKDVEKNVKQACDKGSAIAKDGINKVNEFSSVAKQKVNEVADSIKNKTAKL